MEGGENDRLELYLIEILHQTTTKKIVLYICKKLYLIEILHQTTTWQADEQNEKPLYLIEILHQTTTNKPLNKKIL